MFLLSFIVGRFILTFFLLKGTDKVLVLSLHKCGVNIDLEANFKPEYKMYSNSSLVKHLQCSYFKT